MKTKSAALIAFGGLFFVLRVFAYSTFYTHPDLTEEMAKLFNLKNIAADFDISIQEIKWLRQGAINEDDAPRWINHFYDPVHKTGWSGKHFGALTPEQGLKFGADFAPKPPMASVDWVVDQAQALYGNQQGNQTWQKAVKSFIDGDKKAAFIALGHVLHLVEDASVPDHTRDDTHADLFGDPGSPYEDYSKEYTNSNKLTLAENLKNKDFLNFSNIQQAIESLAVYSNNNFFSEDTINNNDFSKPTLSLIENKEIIVDGKNTKVLFDKNNNIYLAIQKAPNNFTLKDKSIILPSYRKHLFPKAVLTGASVINLFFKEVEYYKQHPNELEPVVPNVKQPLATAIKNSPKRTIVKFFDVLSHIDADVTKITTQTKMAVNSVLNTLGIKLGSAAPLVNTQVNSEMIGQLPQTTSSKSPSHSPVAIAVAPQRSKPQTPSTPKLASAPVSVDEMAPPASQPLIEASVLEIVQSTQPPAAPKPSYVLAVGYVPPPAPQITEENQVILTDASSTAVTSTIDTATSTEVAVTSTILVTTTVEISTTTIVTTTQETTTSTPDVVTSTIPATSTTNIVTSTISTPAMDAGPEVVINEIAWAGTSAAYSNDEWFELYNNTDYDIDLTTSTGWKIFVSGKQVNLTKINNPIISARGYYLLERKEDLVIRDIGADAIYSLAGGFNNNGEKLELFKPNGEKVDEVDAFSGWFAGDKIKYRSMERLDTTKNGNDPANWQSNISYRPVGLNANYAPIYGSPRQSNFGFLVLHSPQEEDIKTLDIKNSPYIVRYYQVPAGKVLNIDSGVDILLQIYGVMEINGSLNALGEPDKPINFLPYQSSTAWGSLKFNNSTSTLNFVNIKKGNRITRLPQNLNGMIVGNNSNLTFNNVLFWDSEANTIGGTGSVFNISNSTIGASEKAKNTYGINVLGGILNLDNVNFSNLFVGVEGGGSANPHPELRKTNMSDARFINVDYIAEPLSWWKVASSTL